MLKTMCLLKPAAKAKCETVKSHKPLTINGFDLVFYRSIHEFGHTLPDSVQENLFLSTDYLTVLEANPPVGFQFCYVLISKNNKIVGFLPFQIKHFKAAESLNFDKNQNRFVLAFKEYLARKVSFNTLISGNLLLTGEHSYWFDNQVLTVGEKDMLFINGINQIKKILTEYNIFIKSVFVKDFFEQQNCLDTEGYNGFSVEPNFIMAIPETWKNFDDYLNALASKYRVRAKRAFKKIETVEKKEFFEERIMAYKTEINDLYRQVSNRSAFNLFYLHPNYFLDLKIQLGGRFRLFGYFIDKKLVGFYTTIQNGDELEAHFLGYDDSLNHEYQVYLNFLFDIVKIGIETGAKHIVFARTAHEIKSSVGAEAHEMYLYMRHEQPLINRLLLPILNILSPRDSWLPRSPFKAKESTIV